MTDSFVGIERTNGVARRVVIFPAATFGLESRNASMVFTVSNGLGEEYEIEYVMTPNEYAAFKEFISK